MNILWLAAYPIRPNQHPAPWLSMLAQGVVRAGHRLTILTPNPKISHVQHIDTGHGFEVIAIPYRGGLLHLLSFFRTQIRAMEEWLSDCTEQFDVIHVHGTELQLASSLARLNPCPPYILSIQGIITLYLKELPNRFSKGGLYWSIGSHYEQKEIQQTREFFCRTAWDQQFIRSLNPEAQITIGWEALRPEFFNYTHPFTGKDLLFIGGDHPLKGLKHALKVFDRLLADGLDIRLHVLGSMKKGSLEKMLSAAKLHHADPSNIVLYGSLDAAEMCRLYRECCCLYHPTLVDNSPNSVCEAQVAGLPVVAGAVGGVPSLITDGLTGLLVKKNDVEDHVQVLERLAGDRALQERLSMNSMKMARERHDIHRIVETTLATYRRLAKPRLTPILTTSALS